MHNVEELKGMTQEDLVRLVQEQEEQIKRVKKDVDYWYESWKAINMKLESVVTLIKSLTNLI